MWLRRVNIRPHLLLWQPQPRAAAEHHVGHPLLAACINLLARLLRYLNLLFKPPSFLKKELGGGFTHLSALHFLKDANQPDQSET